MFQSANTVFLEAIQILQSLQELQYVLGGAMFYHNKYDLRLVRIYLLYIVFVVRVVATQLNAKLTKHLVLTDPYRIKSPAEVVTVDFQLPLGVQLLYVYLDNKQFSALHKDAAKCKNICENIGRKEDKKVVQFTSFVFIYQIVLF